MQSLINPLLTTQNYEKYLKTIKLDYVRDHWQEQIAKAKIALKDAPLYLRETVDRRARGASKTFDTMEIALFLSLIGYRGIWFASGRDQIEQPKIYLKYIINRSDLLKSQIVELLKESVVFKSGGSLKLRNLTELNARSARADYIVYDEEAQADEDAYNAAVSILAGSNLGFVFHISTPTKASVFEKNYDRVKKREDQTGRKLTFRVIWDQASWLKAKEEWYNEQKEILTASGRDWYFRQEHEASFELPMGAVLQNVIYDPYPQWLQQNISGQTLCSGLDWNPVSGHWIVSIKWTKDMRAVVVVEEHDIGIGHVVELTNEQYWIIVNHFTHNKRLVAESGGLNEEYVKWLDDKRQDLNYPDQFLNYEEWDPAGVKKLNAVNFLTQNGITIYVDKRRFSTLAKQVEDLHWDKKATEPKLHKDPADSPHALDAFLHAISELNREDMEFVITKLY